MSDRRAPWLRAAYPHLGPVPASETALLRLLRDVLADPCPWDTSEQFIRYNHDDLPSLDLDEIDRERFRLRVGWAFVGLTDWGAQRLAVLDREAESRRRRSRR